MAQFVLHADEHTAEVHADHAIPRRRVKVVEGTRYVVDACVVERNVESAVLGDKSVDRGGHCRVVGDVEFDR